MTRMQENSVQPTALIETDLMERNEQLKYERNPATATSIAELIKRNTTETSGTIGTLLYC